MAGGPGFEPGTKVPKTLVIPFHHPPTESTDPTGALTREWCLPSPEEVYQRHLDALLRTCRAEPRATDRGFFPRAPETWVPLVTQGVLHAGEKRPLAVTVRHFGVKRLGELLEELALLRCQLLRRDDLDGDDLVTAI